MRKAVAVPYIIALILGVVVIGLLGIWFVTSGGKLGSQSSQTLCDNKFLQYCLTNSDGNYDNFKSGTECVGVTGSYTTCQEILGRQTGQSSKLSSGQECGNDISNCGSAGNNAKCQSGTCRLQDTTPQSSSCRCA